MTNIFYQLDMYRSILNSLSNVYISLYFAFFLLSYGRSLGEVVTENFTLLSSSDCFAIALVIEVMLSSRLLLHDYIRLGKLL